MEDKFEIVNGVKYYGDCLVPVSDPILQVGDKLSHPYVFGVTYVVYTTSSVLNTGNPQYGIMILSGNCTKLLYLTYGGRLFPSLERLSEYASSNNFEKIN